MLLICALTTKNASARPAQFSRERPIPTPPTMTPVTDDDSSTCGGGGEKVEGGGGGGEREGDSDAVRVGVSAGDGSIIVVGNAAAGKIREPNERVVEGLQDLAKNAVVHETASGGCTGTSKNR